MIAIVAQSIATDVELHDVHNSDMIIENTVFDGMMVAQETYGQITWTTVQAQYALGTFGVMGSRVAVIDTESAGIREMLARDYVETGA